MKPEDRYDSLFQYYAELWGIPDWHLLKAQAAVESGFDPNAVSPVGAVGLAQFMPATWQEWWDRVYGVRGLPLGSRTNPERAIELQAAYMAELLSVFENIEPALAAYNWGWGRVRRHLERNGGSLNTEGLPLETQRYLAAIQAVKAKLALA